MNLFLDTNIYLTFYHFSNDDLEELKKLSAAIKSKEINLLLPNQVIDEFYRNREAKIADSLKQFKEQKLADKFPEICKGYSEYHTLRKLSKDYEEAKNNLLESLMTDINSKELNADETIQGLFDVATKIDVNDEILQKAKYRYDLGNPPGKNSSYGDAINWVSLLEVAEESEPLYFVARDKDYLSPIDKEKFSNFLLEEWQKLKKSDIYYYPTLSDFFKSHFPDIKLAEEMERRLVVSNLFNSHSFFATHAYIAELKQYNDFTQQEIQDIAFCCINNQQIVRISQDEDVKSFVKTFLDKYTEKIPEELLPELMALYETEDIIEDVPDDVPF